MSRRRPEHPRVFNSKKMSFEKTRFDRGLTKQQKHQKTDLYLGQRAGDKTVARRLLASRGVAFAPTVNQHLAERTMYAHHKTMAAAAKSGLPGGGVFVKSHVRRGRRVAGYTRRK